jgi:hypothetical protein
VEKSYGNQSFSPEPPKNYFGMNTAYGLGTIMVDPAHKKGGAFI